MSENKNKVIDALTKELADRGLVLEGGWQAYVIASGLNDVPAVQKQEMRKAYFFGAQHLFASIMGILDPGAEATEADLKRMKLIDAELRKFLEEMKR